MLEFWQAYRKKKTGVQVQEGLLCRGKDVG
jgi:hypothetical protein